MSLFMNETVTGVTISFDALSNFLSCFIFIIQILII